MKCLRPLYVLLFVCHVLVSPAQEKSNPKFNAIQAADFQQTISPVADSTADAIVIADAGITTFKGNSQSWVDYVFKRTTRIKLLNKRAFGLATVKIPIYTGSYGKVLLDNVSAITYNLEDGKVSQVRLDKKDIFTDNINKNYTEYRFTLAAVKENSIIEYSYTITSDLFQYLPSWRFQRVNYPCLWSEYEITIPNLVVYLISRRGVNPFFVNETKEGHESYLVKRKLLGNFEEEALSVSANTQKHHWVIRNIPAFNTENYLSSPENYIDRLDFQLYQTSNGESIYNQRNSWATYISGMLNADFFASFMNNAAGSDWLEKPLNDIVHATDDGLQQAKAIYYYIADNFTCTNHDQMYVNSSLQNVFKNRKGNVGELNLLLTDMLLRKHISAAPVVLSTKENGYNNAAYPMLERLNYTICKATIGDKVYYLDASRPGLGFGKLPSYCYNGYARVISKNDTASLYFLPDSIREWNNSYVSIVNDTVAKGVLQGVYENTPGELAAFALREEIGTSGDKKYFDALKNEANNDIQLTDTKIDSLKKAEYPLKVHAGFTIKPAEADILYFSPVLWKHFKTNPFDAAARKWPVEMTYPVNEVYVLNMEIPTGFVVDELPKPAKLVFNNGDASFEYLVQKDEDGLQLKSIIKMKKTYFAPEDYNALRDFFGQVVKKQGEQIVFKRKK